LPIGGISEFTGPASAGRTSLALSVLSEATLDSACAYIDVSDSLDARSAAAAGVRLKNLLWVRFSEMQEQTPNPTQPGTAGGAVTPNRDGADRSTQHHGIRHPRTETKGIDRDLEKMLVQKAEMRLKKIEGTWLRSDAAVRSHALAVIEGIAPLQRVVSINRAARSQGVSRGMSKVQAEATGPMLFRNRSVAEEAAEFEDVLEIAERFSPRIEALSSPLNSYSQAHTLSVSLLIDRTGTETLFGSAEQYARKLKSDLEAADFPCSVATCSNAEASLLLARSHTGVICVQTHELEKRLAPLR
jgi:hypothetical protein